MMAMHQSSWHSYPQIFNLGHRAVTELFFDDVLIEEKVDGSQFSAGFFPDNPDYPDGWRFKSKGAGINAAAPPGMFAAAVETMRHLPVHPGWTYRGEVLSKPHHNVLAYERVPKGNIIIFDINHCQEGYLDYEHKLEECKRIGLECVPRLYYGKVENVEKLRSFLDMTSILGGQKIEGFVIKNYTRFGIDKKVLMGKFVSEAFKEVHLGEWKKANPGGKDILDLLEGAYRTPARWAKAMQHLKDNCQLTDSPKDIGPLIKEVIEDVKKECEEDIKEQLFKWAWKRMGHSLTRGLPEWYKETLMNKQFESGTSEAPKELS